MSTAFVRHFVEMLAAMAVGMMVFGMTGRATFSLFDAASLLGNSTVWVMAMATYMTIAMAVWMRYRGHGWGRITEMGVAMYVPFVLLLVPLGAGLISEHMLNLLGHVLMVLFMLGAMLLRRDEYSHDHSQRAAAGLDGHEAIHGMHH